MQTLEPTTSPDPEPVDPEPVDPEPEIRLSAAAAAVLAGTGAPAPAFVRDPYPYALPLEAGGPSFLRDAFAAMSGEVLDGADPDRWRRAEAMARDPRQTMARLAAMRSHPDVAAAPGTTTANPDLAPVRQMPERYVKLRSAKAPLWSVIAKYGTPDFRTIEVPRTATETGLSGTPADEVTPIAPGTITTDTDPIPIQEVEGAYTFSRKLLLGSNPQIDQIALDAMERAWQQDVEQRAVVFFTAVANSMPVAATYADGNGFITAMRSLYAQLAAGTVYTATDTVPPSKEYAAAAEANSDNGMPVLPYGNRVNVVGDSSAAYAALEVMGVPLWPGPYMPADKTLVLDQSIDSAAAFATPVMNFRLEWTSDATGGNVKLLKLVKYSGVGFWSQYIGGIRLVTNSTPIAAIAAGGVNLDPEADSKARGRK